MNYTRFTNLDVDGALNVDGEVNFSGGASVFVKKLGSVSYSNTTAKTLGKLPEGCIALGGICQVKTAFNGTSPSLIIGLGSDADGLMAAADITEGTTGYYVKMPAATNVVGASGGTNVTATVSGTSVTAGAADVWLIYAKL